MAIFILLIFTWYQPSLNILHSYFLTTVSQNTSETFSPGKSILVIGCVITCNGLGRGCSLEVTAIVRHAKNLGLIPQTTEHVKVNALLQ